jgi:glycosyltransferase involved in cell wall biosynthesis
MSSALQSNFRVLFIGYLLPDRLESKILEQKNHPIQTQRFGLALLNALRLGFDDKLEVLSFAQLFDFPHSSFVIAPGAKWRIDNKIQATMVSFINLPLLKHISRFLATYLFVFKWVLQNKPYNRIIIIHHVQSCKIWGVLLGQILAPCITVSFLTDDIGIPQKWEGGLLKNMRLLDVHLMKIGLQKISGIIAMTSKLAEKLAPGRPVLVIPTIQNPNSAIPEKNIRDPKDDCFTIVYTGGLNHGYGIGLLLDIFKQAKRPNWRLIITGWGEMQKVVEDFAENNPQVKYLGFLDSEGIAEVYRRADVFINPKLTCSPTSDLAFPSKIVEYLNTGKPVVSTNLSIFDDSLREHLIIALVDSPEEMIRCLDNVSSWDVNQRESWRDQTLTYVNNQLSPAAQGTRIHSFINTLK